MHNAVKSQNICSQREVEPKTSGAFYREEKISAHIKALFGWVFVAGLELLPAASQHHSQPQPIQIG